MIEDLKGMIDEISRRIAADIQGDGAHGKQWDSLSTNYHPAGAATYTSAESAAVSEPLTLDTLQKMIASIPPAPKGPVRIIEVDPYPIYGPARRHRKRRIQKKWLKRYGTTIVGYEYPMGDNVLVDEKRGVGYCHPHVARRIRENTTMWETHTNGS